MCVCVYVCHTCHLQISHDASRGHTHSSGTASAILVSLLLVCVLAALGYYVFKHKTDAFRFHYFKVRHTHTHIHRGNWKLSAQLCLRKMDISQSFTKCGFELVQHLLCSTPQTNTSYLRWGRSSVVTILAVTMMSSLLWIIFSVRADFQFLMTWDRKTTKVFILKLSAETRVALCVLVTRAV